MYKLFVLTIISTTLLQTSLALWCYECVSNQPGCGVPFNWLWHWTKVCPEDDDVCVKILEQKEGDTVITRACLSTVQAVRKDIPPDHYEGCRPAAIEEKLGNYVNNTVKELDVHRNYYDNTTWCFCFLDHRCNHSFTFQPSILLGVITLITIYFF